MPITSKDIKLLKSQRLTDQDDGGGRATGVAVIDGQENNLFPDVSRMDRTLGRIALRKGFAGVVAHTADPYLGAHAILTQAPADPRVNCVLFTTGSQTDERAAARNFVENYVVPSVAAPFDMLGQQTVGQRMLMCFQREVQRVPEVGQVFRLVSGLNTQYVRITKVETRIEEFLWDYGNGNIVRFNRRVLEMQISAALAYTFPGGIPHPAGVSGTTTSIFATQVADAASYYGISPLAAAISQGDMTVRVQSVYSHIVPSATREVPLIDQHGGFRRRSIMASGPARAVTLSFGSVTASQSRSFLTTACVRRSLSLTVSGGVFEDDGAGNLRFISGTNSFAKGEVNYETGEVNLYRSSGSAYTGSASATYTPGAAATEEAVTGEIEIELGNRGFSYTLNLAEAKPQPGTLVVSYMALGKWQELSDTGSGDMTGEGTGTVSFATGSVAFTLNALPDVGTSIIYSYVGASEQLMTQRLGNATARARVRITLPHEGIEPGSYSGTYAVGGVAKTITDAGTGVLGGDAQGVINYATGELDLLLGNMPDSGISHDYQQGASIDTVLTLAADGSGVVAGTIPGAPLKPGSVRMNWITSRRQAVPGQAYKGRGQLPIYESTISVENNVTDNGTGGWRGFTGTINYSTGEFSLRVANDYTYVEYIYYVEKKEGNLPGKTRLGRTDTTKQETFAGTLNVRAQEAGVDYGGETYTQTSVPVVLDLLGGIAETVVPNSVVFSFGGETYVERDGQLFKGVSHLTNAGVLAGTLDYNSGLATLTSYPGGAGSVVNLLACLTQSAGFSVTSMTFRTPGAPLRPASLQITAMRADTAQLITAAADMNGQISSGVIHGAVDDTTGIVRLRFTTDIDDDTGASDVPVIPLLLRYNTVLYSTLPLDAKLIGLDPVRLPADGRVPIYRDGDVLVIHHTATTDIGTPTAGSVVTLARDHQADIEVVDKNGVALDPQFYSVNRELGRVTFANPLSLLDEEGAPLVPPLKVRDRVEHMTVCTEVQISGALGLNSPCPWDIPAGEGKVSSALVWGDLQARLYRWFTQATWNSGSPNWSDSQSGSSTTAQYDDLNYPPVVSNFGSIAGKWALVFTSASSFQIVEQQLGVIATGTTGADCAPINPATSTPYFTIRKEGWGSGWSAGNAVRFNTDACLGPLWIARTVLAGQGTVQDDKFQIQVRGDAD